MTAVPRLAVDSSDRTPRVDGAPTPAPAPAPDSRIPSPKAVERDGGGALVIQIYGTPAPQGSKRHVGAGRMIESSKAVKPWREAVKWAVLAHHGNRIDRAPLTGPLAVEVTFTLPRPKNHYRTGRNSHILRNAAPAYPAGKPDLDKLLRSTFDGLGESGVWADDAQVVTVIARKCYPGRDMGALDVAGAVIRIALPPASTSDSEATT